MDTDYSLPFGAFFSFSVVSVPSVVQELFFIRRLRRFTQILSRELATVN
jgi:hypothetical protein